MFAVFTEKLKAENYQALVDLELGYPKEPTSEVGSGIHIDESQAVTLHEFEIIEHKSGDKWATKVIDGLIPTDAQIVTSIDDFFHQPE